MFPTRVMRSSPAWTPTNVPNPDPPSPPLLQAAREGKLDPVIGRDEEIRRRV